MHNSKKVGEKLDAESRSLIIVNAELVKNAPISPITRREGIVVDFVSRHLIDLAMERETKITH